MASQDSDLQEAAVEVGSGPAGCGRVRRFRLGLLGFGSVWRSRAWRGMAVEVGRVSQRV